MISQQIKTIQYSVILGIPGCNKPEPAAADIDPVLFSQPQ